MLLQLISRFCIDQARTSCGKLVCRCDHPQYEDVLAQRLKAVPEADREEYLFMIAARWPDDIRNDPDFHVAEWHYINIPFKPAGQPNSVEVRPPDEDNILTGFDENFRKAKGTDPDEKAVALCWLFHLIGDVHQPLHSSTLFSTEFPEGDRGGTRFYIKVRTTSAAIGLHKLWDDLVLGSERYRSVHNRAIELKSQPAFARSKLNELVEQKVENWAKAESYKLAKEVAYRQGKLDGSSERSAAPVLPDNYIDTIRPVAERRAVLAGYRLADRLKSIFKP